MTRPNLAAGTAALTLSLATASAQTIHNVGPGALPQIRDALAIAATGDRIVVQPGSYAQFVDTVGATIEAASPGTVDIEFDPQYANCTSGPLCVLQEAVTRLLPPPGATSHLVGLNFSGATANAGTLGPVLTTVFVGSGRTVFDDCTIVSHNLSAVTIDSADTHFVRCAVTTVDTVQESQALRATASTVTATSSQFRGPTALQGISGAAVALHDSTLHGSHLTLTSGLGSPNTPAISADATSTVWLSDSNLVGSSPTACATDIAGTVRLARCTTSSPASCPSVPTGFLIGAEQNQTVVGGQPFSITYAADPSTFIGVMFGYELTDRTVPILEQPWFLPANALTAGLYLSDAQGTATASWTIPAAFAGDTVWLHSVGGVTIPLQVAPPHGGVVTQAASPPMNGSWLPPFPHDLTGFPRLTAAQGFNAIHMNLIPTGPHRGKVMVMDREFTPTVGTPWRQRWSVVDVANPSSPTFQNFVLDDPNILPAGEGDLFCAGHAWDPRGQLLVAGGTTEYLIPGQSARWKGGRLALWFDPTQPLANAWSSHASPFTQKGRWYPTVLLAATGELLVLGGTQDSTNGTPQGQGLLNDFEVHDGNQWNLFPGPTLTSPENNNDYFLGFYPRMHVLRSGRIFLAAHSPRSRRLTLQGVQWESMDNLTQTTRGGSTVLFPNIGRFKDHDVVMVMGGKQGGFNGVVTDKVHFCSADAPRAGAFPGGWDWDSATWPAMAHRRWRANATILPDASIFVMGGDRSPDPTSPNPVLVPELFTVEPSGANPTWTALPTQAGPRTYHATAMLMPDGRVLIGGGDTRTRGSSGVRWDYQIWEPAYISAPDRPSITAFPATMRYNSVYSLNVAPLAPGRSVQRVVLMRPGSVTHHQDYDQRYKALDILNVTGNAILVRAPLDAAAAPPGHYMVFVVDDRGVPSEAGWTRFQ